MQLMSGIDVFAHVCGQKADTSTNYCESIHLYDKTLQFSVKCVRLFFFRKLPQIQTSNFRKVVRQHTEGMVKSIIWVLLKIYFSFQE